MLTRQSRRAPGYLLAAITAGILTGTITACTTPPTASSAAPVDEFGVCVNRFNVRYDAAYCTPGTPYYTTADVLDYYSENAYPTLPIVAVGQRMVWPANYIPVHVAPRNTTIVLNLPAKGGTSSGIRSALPTTKPTVGKTTTAPKTPPATTKPAVSRGGLGVTRAPGAPSGATPHVSAGS